MLLPLDGKIVKLGVGNSEMSPESVVIHLQHDRMIDPSWKAIAFLREIKCSFSNDMNFETLVFSSNL